MSTGLHPFTWTAWLGSVCAFAFVASNPLYVAVAGGAVVIVHLSRPSDASPAGRAPRTFLLLGLGLLVVRLGLVGLVAHQGETVLARLPETRLPALLGGIRIGGAMTGEVLAEAGVEGLRLVVVMFAFGVLNAAVDTSALVRRVPPGFRDAGLVLSIALAFLPELLRTISDVRDAQRLRGDRGLRAVAPSAVVPVLGLTLDRAFLLAESMEARGYGACVVARPQPALVGGALTAVVGGVAIWTAGATMPGTVLTGFGAASLLAVIAVAARRGGPRARLDKTPWTIRDAAVVCASAAVVVVVLAAEADLSYTSYPALAAPPFSPPLGAAFLLMAAPAIGRSR